jgi:hypothetical protein
MFLLGAFDEENSRQHSLPAFPISNGPGLCMLVCRNGEEQTDLATVHARVRTQPDEQSVFSHLCECMRIRRDAANHATRCSKRYWTEALLQFDKDWANALSARDAACRNRELNIFGT